MALLNKFFPGRRKLNSSSSNLQDTQSHSQSIDFPFSADQVRVLLFRECDFQGRKLLFDSSAIQKTDIVPQTQINTTTPQGATARSGTSSIVGNGKPVAPHGTAPNGINPRKKYTYGRPQSDHNDLGEMVWGTAAMNFRGTSLKVHWLRKPSRILCSQIFLSPASAATGSGKPVSSPMNMSLLNARGFDGTASDISSLDTTSMSSFTGDSAVYSPVDGSRTSFQLDPLAQQHPDVRWSSGTDSGVNSDSPWNTSTSSYPYPSTRSSFGSVYSTDQDQRKTSIDSSIQGDFFYNNGGCMGMTNGQGAGGTNVSGQQMQRRVMRHLSTSFENHSTLGDYIGMIGDSTTTGVVGGSDACVSAISKWRRNSEVIHNDRLSNPEMARRKASGETISIPFYSHGRLTGSSASGGGGHGGHGNARRSKLGIAVCVTLQDSFESEMKVFFSEHICLFESLLNRLRAIVEGSYSKNRNVSHAMFRAWKVTRQYIQDLLMAPRIVYPVWLTLSSGPVDTNNNNNSNKLHPATLADTFVSELCVLLANADTKDTNFFISTLLTATLTHHLGWVGSVAPIHTATSCTNPHSIEAAVNEQQAKRSEISKTHPYNALWAQMSDLYGAIGHPPKISRTIVVGKCHKTMDKILNVLTYFIRCGDIRKSDDACTLDRSRIETVMANVDEHLVDLDTTPFGSVSGVDIGEEKNEEQIYFPRFGGPEEPSQTKSPAAGLYRTASHVSKLDHLALGVAMPIEALTSNKTPDMVQVLTKNVMNDIPNVIAYRDSRFVKQELRIGNHLMDTGREMDKPKTKFRTVKSQQEIKLMVTGPDDELIDVEEGVPAGEDADGHQQHMGMMRRNDSAPMLLNRSLSALITDNSLGSTKEATKLLWGIEPVKEGIGFDQWRHWERGVEIREETRFDDVWVVRGGELCEKEDQEAFLRRGLFTKSQTNHLPKSYNHLVLRRSRIGRRRSGQGSGMLELREDEEQEGTTVTSQHNNDVVFVLGDNEELVLREQHNAIESQPAPGERNLPPLSSTPKKKNCCNHKAKKHSGVKFNFEQYPQIVENYMRNKNFAMEGSEILAKAIKMERAAGILNESAQEGHSRAMEQLLRNGSMSPTSSGDEGDECECCAGFKSTGGLLQTPSNASELDIEWDNNYSQMEGRPGTSSQDKVAAAASSGAVPKQQLILQQIHHSEMVMENLLKVVALPMPNVEPQRVHEDRNRSSLVPMRSVEDESLLARTDEVKNPFSMTTKWGMVPSLMLGVTDHYVPDMVLQGIKMEATQSKQLCWEMNLRQDLLLSAHCATIEQVPTENVAIVANVDDWEVRIVSSNGGSSTPMGVGEKDLGCVVSFSASVVSMLETVQAMWNCGLPSYQCMSFIEAKLQELYCMSEALAKFLMATEFCKLDDLTKALDVSANDIQLLLSIAATHSPQVTRKYGLSFR